MKELGYEKISFRKNNEKWNTMICSEICYQEPFKYEELVQTYNQFLDSKICKNYFTKKKRFILNNEYVYWKDYDENCIRIYPNDTITIKKEWIKNDEYTFSYLSRHLPFYSLVQLVRDRGNTLEIF